MTRNPGKHVTDYDVAELFALAHEATAYIDKAKSGFEKTGIFPYNPDVFSEEDYLSSAVTERRVTFEPAADAENSSKIEVILKVSTGMFSVFSTSVQLADISSSSVSKGRSSSQTTLIKRQPSATSTAVSSKEVSHRLPKPSVEHSSKRKSDLQHHEIRTTKKAASAVTFEPKKKTGICLRRGTKTPQDDAHKVMPITKTQRPNRLAVVKRWSLAE
jgi:hypothetical protein